MSYKKDNQFFLDCLILATAGNNCFKSVNFFETLSNWSLDLSLHLPYYKIYDNDFFVSGEKKSVIKNDELLNLKSTLKKNLKSIHKI